MEPMKSLALRRAALVFGGGFALATSIGAVANAVNLGRDETYLLAAAAIALIAGLGVPWALGWSRPLLLKDRDEVQAHEAAVVAHPGKHWVALSYDETLLVTHRLQQHGGAGKSPIIHPATGAVFVCAPSVEGVSKRIKVVDLHRHDPTMFSGGLSRKPRKSTRPSALARLQEFDK